MVKELAQVIDDFGPCDEDLPHAVIDDQVQVPLPEPCFLHQPIRTAYRKLYTAACVLPQPIWQSCATLPTSCTWFKKVIIDLQKSKTNKNSQKGK